MATLLLSAAGAAVGGSFAGTALGLGGAVIGRAVGATVGAVLDQKLLGEGSDPVDTGRLGALRLQGAREGTPIARMAGRARVAGQLIWSTRFLETVSRRGGGGKGVAPSQPEVREYSYSVSIAIGLCEGEILRIGRVWADGKPFALERTQYRLHRGAEDQEPDPLIEAVEGAEAAPAYRGTAYLVFENLAVGTFGNRIPQFNVEVFRRPDVPAQYLPDGAVDPGGAVRGVAMTPGTGEYALAPDPVSYSYGKANRRVANVNNTTGETDLEASTAQLSAELPACDAVSLIVSWFGTDLRCGECVIKPGVEQRDFDSPEMPWRVSGVSRSGARVVSDTEGRPNFGGTPTDQSVIRAIQRLRAQGRRVTFYPFILMDVAQGNTLPDPWSGAGSQPVFPWRGRITLSAAPGQPGSPDMTAAAASEVSAFFGAAAPEDFTASGETVSYSGPAEWGFRRFILHYARLCKAAGGVDAFLIGSEMRSLTWIRDGAGSYPAVVALRALAADVREILGPDTKISYAADWSEYSGHRPDDGSGDVFFHLDPLWAHPAVDFVGIDNYMPLSDWRDGAGHLDAQTARSIYDLDYLRANVAGGEGYDWYYADAAARAAQTRTPIVDTAHGEHWVFRYKDLVNWWSQPHHNRAGGVRAASQTAWVPQSKPIWFTEYGCPAVDRGTNQPNVFVDPKSSESALPYFSQGARDDFIQLRYLQAVLGYWSDPGNNPVSSVYGAPMLDLANAYVWAWDARPWPDFPARQEVWADGPNYELGHWISGRMGSSGLAELVAELCLYAGLTEVDVSGLHGVVDGFVMEVTQSTRQALQPLMLAYGFDAFERDGTLVFRMREGEVDHALEAGDFAVSERGDDFGPELVRGPAAEIPEAVQVSFPDMGNAYQISTVEAALPAGRSGTRADRSDLPITLSAAQGQAIADRWLSEARVARDTARFSLPASRIGVEPGDVVSIASGGGVARYRVDRVEDVGLRRVDALRVDASVYGAHSGAGRSYTIEKLPQVGPVYATFLDLPLLRGNEVAHAPWVAAAAVPWPGPVAVYDAAQDDGYELDTVLRSSAVVGETLDVLPAARPWLWTRGVPVRVKVSGGLLEARSGLEVLNGANLAALRAPGAQDWEVVQFRQADLVDTDTWALSGLLRGQAGTEFLTTEDLPAGADFVLMGAGCAQIDLPSSMRGIERHYRIGPTARGYDDATYTHVVEAFEGVGLRPWSPVHAAARRQADGDIDLRWTRRSRRDGDAWSRGDVPLAEESEAYLVRVFATGGALLREVETATPFLLYTAAEQAADGLSAPFAIEVAQVSASYGPGPSLRIEIDE
ncbi:host specificity protein [Paroceanicella profunda]|uniref:Host specificity protein n=1 Tax=Paroceanicella profunda TaxID=2579971 RepID=A0A5B8G325_9RHOB|nr:glycoside hydrolase/phage tail family protein [Paroceanicella profunda]QDL93073.1 host specificity protein [Paroceanicella profunda]